MTRALQRLHAGMRYVAKFLTALVAAAGIAVDAGLFSGRTAQWVAAGIAFAGALGVYTVPNRPVMVP